MSYDYYILLDCTADNVHPSTDKQCCQKAFSGLVGKRRI